MQDFGMGLMLKSVIVSLGLIMMLNGNKENAVMVFNAFMCISAK